MPDEVTPGAVAAGSGDSGAPAGGGAGGGSVAPPQTDVEFLSAAESAPAVETTKPADAAPPSEKPDAAPEEVNLSLLEEAQPEWFAKITDEAAKGEVQKLLDLQKSLNDKFKAAPDELFKDLPGGREQLTALQTLSKEVTELDGHIAANTPESNAIVVGRYLEEAPDKGVGLFRAGAQHLAKANPEGWKQVGDEILNATLKASGIGVDSSALLAAISEMRDAVQKGDGEAFGKAAGKLLGEPQKETPRDPNAERTQAELAQAKTERTKAQTESWKFRNDRSSQKVDNHISTETGKLLSKVLPAGISEKDRASLRGDIGDEVMSQLLADKFHVSKIIDLIGFSKPDGKGGFDYSNVNLSATQEVWDQAEKMILERLTPQLISRATAKVVSQWSKDRAASNKEAREKARSMAAKPDVGAGKTPVNGKGKKPLTEEQFRKMSDEEFLAY
jgi:hypothetical protein